VVLDVAVAADGSGRRLSSNSWKIMSIRLAQDVGEDVEPAAVGHAHDDLLGAGLGRRSTIWCSAGISDSAPSSEKRFWPW
jgi:hypothetical protein